MNMHNVKILRGRSNATLYVHTFDVPKIGVDYGTLAAQGSMDTESKRFKSQRSCHGKAY